MKVPFGESIEGAERYEKTQEGEIIEIVKNVGDVVEEDEAILVLETDKVVLEVCAPVAGVLAELCVAVGDRWRGWPMGYIETADEAVSVDAGEPLETAPEEIPPQSMPMVEEANHIAEARDGEDVLQSQGEERVVSITPLARLFAERQGITEAEVTARFRQERRITREHVERLLEERRREDVVRRSASSPSAKPRSPDEDDYAATTTVTRDEPAQRHGVDGKNIRAVPAARLLAREHGLDLAQISGSGPDGLITLSDIEDFAEGTHRESASPSFSGETAHAATATPDIVTTEYTAVKASMRRKAIAERLSFSWRTIPHAGDEVTIDVTTLVVFRETTKTVWEKLIGVSLRYDHFFLFYIARHVLADEFKILNAYWDDNAQQIVYCNAVNIGIAINAPEGLIVPVIRGAEKMPFEALVLATEDKIGRARANLLRPDDLDGLTITFNNVGALGGQNPRPIIPATKDRSGALRPTGVIFASGAIQQRGRRFLMTLVYAFDHRLMDAGPIARFVAKIKADFEAIDSPHLWGNILGFD
ncbi:MAG: dihydrolipoamide acetyltransferase family protein [Patescibacteria group bacterium]